MITGSLYDRVMHPLETWGGLAQRRKQLIPLARGRVLEVGIGSGANLPYFLFDQIQEYYGIDLHISPTLERKAGDRGIPGRFEEGDVRELPFPDSLFDTIVFTLVFCSVPEPLRGLLEIARVLKPGGRILFIEHGLPPGRPALRQTLHLLTPCWRPLAGGCHLNREPLHTIEAAGFTVNLVQRFGRGILVAGIGTRPEESRND